MSLRILHVTDAAASGVLAAVTALARAQAELPGADITLAYVPRPDSPSHGAIEDLVGPNGRTLRWSRGVRGAVPALAVRTSAALARGRYDVVHLHSSRAGLIGRAAALLTGHRARTVYSPHSFAFDRSAPGSLSRRVLHGLERVGTALGDRLVLVSDTEDALARRALPGARTAVLHNRVDARAVAAHADRVRAGAERRPGAGLRIVHVGRICAQKRPGDLARIARLVRAEEIARDGAASTTFRWIGDGDRTLLDDVAAARRNPGAGPVNASASTTPDAAAPRQAPRPGTGPATGTTTPDVEVTGWLDRTALLTELAGADVMLMTTAGEGLSVAALEAQAVGLPVLAHDVTGMSDVVDDGRTGLLRPDTDALLEALRDLAADPERLRAMGAAARRHALSRFDVADLAADSLAAYRRLGIDVGAATVHLAKGTA